MLLNATSELTTTTSSSTSCGRSHQLGAAVTGELHHLSRFYRTAPRPAFTDQPFADQPFTDHEPVPILKVDTAEGPAVKRGHRQRSLPYAGGRPHLHAGPSHLYVWHARRYLRRPVRLLHRRHRRSCRWRPVAAGAPSSPLPVP